MDPDGTKITIEVQVTNPELHKLLTEKDEEERKRYVKRALDMGLIALQGTETRMQLDYVKTEFERMQDDVCNELEKYFSEKGRLQNDFDKFLGEKGELKRQLDVHFGDEGGKIFRILNPDDESTPIGKFRKRLQEELDADREGTAFHKMLKAMDEGFEKVIIKLEATKAAEKAAKEEREKGTAKGLDLETYVYESLDSMARHFDDVVEHIGRERGPLGDVGDVLIQINPRDTGNMERNIVVEVKNRRPTMSGKNSFFKELKKAKENRGAHYAIGAVHESKIPDACGCFRMYPSKNIVCRVSVDEEPLPLEIAYKVARAELVLSTLREKVKLDPSQLKAKVTDIQGQLETVQAVKRSMSGATNNIEKAKKDLETMEASIKSTLNEIFTLIKSG